MIAVATNATKTPIQAKRLPSNVAKEPTGPKRVLFPIPNSAMISGTLQRKRKMTHGMRNDPPPFAAAMRGKRQMFPVPTAIPITEITNPQRELNRSGFNIVPIGLSSFGSYGSDFERRLCRRRPRRSQHPLSRRRVRSPVEYLRWQPEDTSALVPVLEVV